MVFGHISLPKCLIMEEEKKEKDNRGRKGKPKEERVTRLPLYAKNKNHEAILIKVAPIVKKLDNKN